MKLQLVVKTAAMAAAVLVGTVALTMQASGAEFKWSFSGDAQSLDPYALGDVQTLGFQSNFYEPLVRRDASLKLEPALATEWTALEPTVWRFKLRPNVTFHNGASFSADDVIFSFKRSQAEGSDVKAKIRSIKEIRKVNDLTIDVVTNGPSPLLLGELSDWFIMDKEWSEKNDVLEPADTRKGKENYATLHANGTGPFKVTKRQPDVRTEFEPHAGWWGKVEHNLTKGVFLPIKSAPTRIAALLSGEVDMVYPVPIQDVPRLRASPKTDALQSPEIRVIFVGFDHRRDELLYSSVKGKNPFKDLRVRKAFYHAIDVGAIVEKIMNGAVVPAGTALAEAVHGFSAELNRRWDFDLDKAKALMSEAGYADGFELTLDCPNDRYLNDEQVCLGIGAMLAKLGVKVSVNAMSKTKYFGKILARDTSFYLLGWAPPTLDAHNPLYDLFSTAQKDGHGKWNMGDYSNSAVDKLVDAIALEVETAKRDAMINEAMILLKNDVAVVPLYQQTLSWGKLSKIDLAQRADNKFELRWVKVNK